MSVSGAKPTLSIELPPSAVKPIKAGSTVMVPFRVVSVSQGQEGYELKLRLDSAGEMENDVVLTMNVWGLGKR